MTANLDSPISELLSESSYMLQLFIPLILLVINISKKIWEQDRSPSIKHVNIDLMCCIRVLGEKPSILFKWLVDLSNIESVTVTLCALKVLYIVTLLQIFMLYLYKFYKKFDLQLILILCLSSFPFS